MGEPMRVQPLTLTEAMAFVNMVHRHHKAPQGGIFAIGLSDGDQIIGCAIVGRPVARMNDDGWTAEITRVAVIEGHKNACSMLYGACSRAAHAMGYGKVITYTLAEEGGASLKASNFRIVSTTAGGGSWSRVGRPRVDKHPTQQKIAWSHP